MPSIYAKRISKNLKSLVQFIDHFQQPRYYGRKSNKKLTHEPLLWWPLTNFITADVLLLLAWLVGKITKKRMSICRCLNPIVALSLWSILQLFFVYSLACFKNSCRRCSLRVSCSISLSLSLSLRLLLLYSFNHHPNVQWWYTAKRKKEKNPEIEYVASRFYTLSWPSPSS